MINISLLLGANKIGHERGGLLDRGKNRRSVLEEELCLTCVSLAAHQSRRIEQVHCSLSIVE